MGKIWIKTGNSWNIDIIYAFFRNFNGINILWPQRSIHFVFFIRQNYCFYSVFYCYYQGQITLKNNLWFLLCLWLGELQTIQMLTAISVSLHLLIQDCQWRKEVQYSNLPSTIRPNLNSDSLPVYTSPPEYY